ncbi:hypothetical protein Nepgr_029491 [Nepenthes gracilis]|uniref:Uncharacterized protein n=1 Tax=Nepenthes gracilis TaxID=150966 RepID=A0AAD3TCJ7_NEPGR|nr:hypothetical protein Nepgr_029491 [Nepenthes gracilis]
MSRSSEKQIFIPLLRIWEGDNQFLLSRGKNFPSLLDVLPQTRNHSISLSSFIMFGWGIRAVPIGPQFLLCSILLCLMSLFSAISVSSGDCQAGTPIFRVLIRNWHQLMILVDSAGFPSSLHRLGMLS